VTVSFYTQGPNDARTYGVEWLVDQGDSLTASTWACSDSAVTLTNRVFTNTPVPKTSVKFSGAFSGALVLGTTYEVVNHITTASGQGVDHTLYLLIVEG
jgi:hypothetical protein